jgi:hypothetical protein
MICSVWCQVVTGLTGHRRGGMLLLTADFVAVGACHQSLRGV